MATGSIFRIDSKTYSTTSPGYKPTEEDDAKYQAALKAKDEAKKKQREEDFQDQERAFSFSKRGLDAKTDAQSRLQKERSHQGIEAQKAGTESQSRLQRERSDQALTSQREGVEGQSRLQRERTEQSSKLQSQAAAEAAARKAGDRAAAIANFRSRGGSKTGK